jgi:hypothetical protein
MIVVKCDKAKLVCLKISVERIEDKCDGYIIKGIQFIGFTILKHVSEEVLFIRQLSVILKMIENMLVHFFIGAIFIVISSIALLPLERKKSLFAVCHFLPIFACGHDLSDEVGVVPSSHIILV